MSNCEKIARAVAEFAGMTLTTAQVIAVTQAMYPEVKAGSIIPSDHAGANLKSGRTYCNCAGSTAQVFTRTANGYMVNPDAVHGTRNGRSSSASANPADVVAALRAAKAAADGGE